MSRAQNVQHCKQAMEFFVKFDNGPKAFLSYKELPNKVLDFEHTVTPKEYQGKGIAKQLVQEGLRFASDNKFRVKASCWYVEKYYKEMASDSEKKLFIADKSSL